MAIVEERTVERASNVCRRLRLEIGRVAGQRVRLEPDEWVSECAEAQGGYLDMRDRLAPLLSRSVGGDTRLESLYPRYGLVSLVARLEPREFDFCLPRSVEALMPPQLERIVDQVETFDEKHFEACREEAFKDLGLLRGRLVPTGSRFIEKTHRPSRRVLLWGGPRQFLRAVRRFGLSGSGLVPSLAMHFHLWALGEHDSEAQVRGFHRCADVLAVNPRLKGNVGESWLVDPRVGALASHLGFPSRLTRENGGEIFLTGHRRRATRLATANSDHRRRLVEEGTYRPVEYLRFWPREAMIEWSGRTRDPAWGPVGEESRIPAPLDTGEARQPPVS